MPTYVALLRAINVGRAGILRMKDLTAVCEGAGFRKVRTYIRSGNVLFESELRKHAVRAKLQQSLADQLGKHIGVTVRTASELVSILNANPFPGMTPSKVAILFLSSSPPGDLLKRVVAPGGEQVIPGDGVIYIYYPNGMGRSRLKLPLDDSAATARNVNTVAKLAAMAAT